MFARSAGTSFASLALLLLAIPFCAEAGRVVESKQTFVTRPEIEAPRWNITVHDREQLSPGYWFVAPYESLEQSESGAGWNAPMIFDQEGTLVWSGAYLTNGSNTFDFRASTVAGESILTFLRAQDNSAVMLDQHLNLFKELSVANSSHSELLSPYELNFVNDGTRALFFYDQPKHASKKQSHAMGYVNGTCRIRESTFREADLNDEWRFVYRWSASKRIGFDESVMTEETLEQRCNETEHGWDFAHLNSVDRFADGSYLLSARHTNTIYHVLRDGDIAWRLGGDKSDFQGDFTFSRQNHARIVSHNASQTVISFFDNSGSEHGNASSSRGLLVALKTDVEPKTAKLLAEYPHPKGPGSYVEDFGTTQVLPNGNVFSGWVDGLLVSEHDPDGNLITEAHAEGEAQTWMRTSRAYKLPFFGQPSQPPDVHAEVHRGDGDVETTVYVSWNGATEVTRWKVYSTTPDGEFESRQLVAEVEKEGFETKISIAGDAGYVVAEAVDAEGEGIGRSDVLLAKGSTTRPTEKIEGDEKATHSSVSNYTPSQDDQASARPTPAASSPPSSSWKDKAKGHGTSIFGLLGLLVLIAGAFFLVRYWLRRRRSRSWTSAAAGGHRRMPSDHELLRRDRSVYALDDDGEDEDYDERKAGR